MNWDDGTRDFQATSGIGMPFVYFEKTDPLQLKLDQ